MTEPTVDPIEVTSARQLLEDVGVDLEGIVHYEYSASLNKGFMGALPDELEHTTEYTLLTHLEVTEIGVRLRTDIETPSGKVCADIAAQYVAKVPVHLTHDAHEEFVNSVAIMAILPFTREAVMSLSSRIFGKALMMPVMKRGEVSFSIPTDEPEIEEGEAADHTED